ncbi:MAG: helix-turn-helix transcriptional regulator [Bacteroidetes bacterium]|nr:helix-turn-helix transcriptional regulator [Bacteroidota bacterium]
MPENSKTPTVKIIDAFPHPTAYKYNEDLWYQQHSNSLVIINCMASNIEYPEHWTPLSVKCAFGGKEYYHFPNNSLAVSPENFLILNEGTTYRSSIRSEHPTESFSLNFTKQNIQQVVSCLGSNHKQQLHDPFQYNGEAPRFVEKLYSHDRSVTAPLLRIRDMAKEKNKDTNQYIEMTYSLLEGLVQLHKKVDLEIDSVHAKRRATREELYKRLTLAKDYMDCFLGEEISLDDLSKICFLNPFYLLREFRKNFNITPHQYLMQQRLRQAELLLSDSDISITELGKKVGFKDLSSFSKLFKRYSGQSPENFRKNLR